MSKKIRVFIVCLLLALGMKVAIGQTYNVDPKLEPYLNEFVELAKEKGIDLSYIYNENITIKFISKKTNDNGSSVVASSPSWKIRKGVFVVVRVEAFKNRSEEGRKYAMFHEFGHDILNIDHQPKGMMKNTSYTKFFKKEYGPHPYYNKENQSKVLYKSLDLMFDLYLGL